MTIFQIECFITAAQELNFLKAAEKMCMTQPAISYQINALEKELGSKLLDRTTRSCRLTPSGMAFYQDMKHMLVLYRQSVQRVQDIDSQHRSTLNVGIRKFFDYENMSKMTIGFKQLFPKATLNIIPHNDSAPLEDLRSGRIDVGFCYNCEHTEVADIVFKPLYNMRYHVLMNPRHALSEKKSLMMRDLKSVPVVTGDSSGTFLSACAGNTLEELQKAGADLSISVPSYESAMILIQMNSAVCVLPMLDSAQIPGMVKIPISDCESVTMELCHMRSDPRYTVRSFVQLAEENYGVHTQLADV